MFAHRSVIVHQEYWLYLGIIDSVLHARAGQIETSHVRQPTYYNNF